MQSRMLWNLFKLPTALLLGAVCVIFLFGVLIPSWFASSAMLAKAAELLYLYAPWLGLALLIGSVVYYYWSGYRLWRWMNGNEATCSQCGGMVKPNVGRYGPYLHCLACGKNESN